MKKLIFLTMSSFYDLETHNIYADLLKEFISNGHMPYLVSPVEKKYGEKSELIDMGTYKVLKVLVGNMSHVSLLEKGISTVFMEKQFTQAIKVFLKDVRFDLILYSTPPVTFAKVISYLKRIHNAPTYLLLKDIFPQNAVDLGMFREGSIIHKFFRKKEKDLYALSDYIGCMSRANMDYLLRHNPQLSSEKVHVNPNSIKPVEEKRTAEEKEQLRKKYGIPLNAVVFMYGGNMGKPQNIPFVVECLRAVENREDSYFIMCGTGNDYSLLEDYIKERQPRNVMLINGLPKKEYDALLGTCDVGLIFLDYRFTIPNYPSRILSYMEQSMPVLVCTDTATDVGKTVVDGGFGWYCESNDSINFLQCVNSVLNNSGEIKKKGALAGKYLREMFNVTDSCKLICEKAL